ncbi:hypothetical protein JCM9279_002261 [Rhodotorula babjevae]
MPAQRRPRSSLPAHDPAPPLPRPPSPSPSPSPPPSSPAAPASEFRRDFTHAVYACVRRIPEGRVASYGRIAHLVGHPRHSRMVGAALKALPRALALPFAVDPAPRRRRREADVRSGDDDDDDDGDGAEGSRSPTARRTSPSSSSSRSRSPSPSPLPPPAPNPSFVPWHRVVASSGLISPRGNPAATRRQAEWLEAEGVVVVRRADAQGGGGGGGARGGGGEDGGGREHGDAFGLGARVDGGGRVSMAQFAWQG